MRHRGKNSVFYIQYSINNLKDSTQLNNQDLNWIDFRVRRDAAWVGDIYVHEGVIQDNYLFNDSLINTLRQEGKPSIYHLKIFNKYKNNLRSTCSQLKAPFIEELVKHT